MKFRRNRNAHSKVFSAGKLIKLITIFFYATKKGSFVLNFAPAQKMFGALGNTNIMIEENA